LQKTDATFFETGGCVACHSQNVTAIAVAAGRANGAASDANNAGAVRKVHELEWDSFEQPLLVRIDAPGGVDMTSFGAFAMLAYGVPPSRITDAMAANVAVQQMPTGEWPLQGIVRPPMEDGA